MVLTKGDSMAELAERRGLGATVDAEDDAGFARAVAELLDDAGQREATAARVREEAEAFRWQEAARPLVDFCVGHRERPVRDVGAATIARATYGQVPSILADAVRTTGPLGLARRVGRQVGRVLRHGA